MTEGNTNAAGSLRALVDRLSASVVGRVREVELVVAAISADRHIVIEGPPGTGKSTLLRAVAREMELGFEFVEGNAELTPARLVGHFDPARVLSDGYDPDVFVPGPLAAALRDGSLLYIEELNRVPEETLNVLITVMSERELNVPRLGRIEAAPGFRLVSAMNPFDAIGTARISSAVYDRVCRVAVDYQSVADELTILRKAIAQQAGIPVVPFADSDADDEPDIEPDIDIVWLGKVVELARATRDHADLRIGSSIRGAIDMVLVAATLADVRDAPQQSPSVSLDAALVALSGRVRLREGTTRTAEEVIREIWEGVFGRSTGEDGDGEGKDGAPTKGATNSR